MRETGKRATRDCGSSREIGAGDGVNEGNEVCVDLRGLDAPELHPEVDEDAVGTAPWKCKCRCTGAVRANKSLMIVVNASLSRTPFGRTCFPTGDGVTDGGDCGDKILEISETGQDWDVSGGEDWT